MNIHGLQVDEFGVWSNLKLDGLDPGLNIFYGPNEAGKSTLLQFVRSMFYGFTQQRRQYLAGSGPRRSGGQLSVNSKEGRYDVARRDDLSGNPHGELAVTGPDGMRQGEHLLKSMLADVDELVFNNVFAVSLHELQELATLSDTQAADLLYRITAGLDRVSLIEVLRELNASRNRILSPSGDNCQIVQLLAEREKLLAELQGHAGAGRQYGRLAGEHSQLHREIARLEDEAQQIETHARHVDLAHGLRPRWRQRAELDQHLAALGDLGPAPLSLEPLDKLRGHLRHSQQAVVKLAGGEEEIKRELAQLQVDENLDRHSARVEALAEQQPWARQLEERIAADQKEIAELEAQLNAERQQSGLHAAKGHSHQVPPRLLATLRPLARAVRDSRAEVKKAHGRHSTARQQVKVLAGQFEHSLKAKGETDLTAAMQRVGEEIAQLRRRKQVDDRLAKLTDHHAALDSQGRNLLDKQETPMWIVVGLGGMLMLGVVLVVLGLFSPTTVTGNLGWAMTILGIGGIVAAIGGKNFFERAHESQFDSHHKQVSLLQDQLKQVQEERDNLDRQLPAGSGSIRDRLQKAEQHLALLEELAPLDEQRQAAEHDVRQAHKAIAQAKNEHATNRKRWREALAAARLPEDFTLKHVRHFVQRSGNMEQLQRRLAELRQDMAARQADLAGFAQRVTAVATDAGMEKAAPTPLALLQAMAAAVTQQKALVQRHAALSEQARQLRRQQRSEARRQEKIKHRRRGVLRRAGVKNEKAYRDLVARQAKAAELTQQREAVHREITAALGGVCPEETVAGIIDQDAQRPIESLQKECADRRERVQQQLRERHARRGQLSEQMRAMAEDRTRAAKQFTLGMLEKRLEDLVCRWQVLAVTSRMLDTIRSAYELDRQPESLKEASTYLERLTRGRYRRVWLPLGEGGLRVDGAEGNALGVEFLSRGTREQLFLALRLALVASYGRRGAALPMILDDVLVNFDMHRAKAAAGVLQDFAKAGHQILIFTCHEHIFKLFKGLECHAAVLPDRGLGLDDGEPDSEPSADRPARRRPRRDPSEPRRKPPEPSPEPPAPVEPVLVEIDEPDAEEFLPPAAPLVAEPPPRPLRRQAEPEPEFDEFPWEEAVELTGTTGRAMREEDG